jgi:ribosomal protein S18 acetylase RimI-like enzyme
LPNLAEPSQETQISISCEDPKSLLDTLEQIYRQAYASLPDYGHQDPQEVSSYLRSIIDSPVTQMLIAREDGRIKGFAAVECKPSSAEVWEIAVSPGQQKHGLGQRLLQAACDLARAEDYSQLNLWVGVHNQQARKFYEKQGFEYAGRAGRWLKMHKVLDA